MRDEPGDQAGRSPQGHENAASFRANGTGPYRLRERQPNVRTTFVRNGNYWGKRLPYDPEAAKKLLSEAGCPNGFEVTMNCPNDRYVNDARICQAVAANLSRIGVKINLAAEPRHPYTRMLLDAIPKMHEIGRARTAVQGEVPNPLNPPTGCAFHPRCPHANARCKAERPALLAIQGIRVARHAVEEGRI